ncbi:MAG: YkgJ family cysteine cluster protein [Pseudomonadota bacterium]
MNTDPLFHGYELLVDRADAAFKRMTEEHGDCIRCERHCSDCCHAVFGLFLIEAAYLQKHFVGLGLGEREAALLRGQRADRDFREIEKRLECHEDDPQMRSYVLARERVRCPLLDDREDCILYSHRPITCRIYGIPTRIQGKARVCGKAGFKKGPSYPAFDLDGTYRDLFNLSRELLNSAGIKDSDKVSLLVSVSKAIHTSVEDLIIGDFGSPAEAG